MAGVQVVIENTIGRSTHRAELPHDVTLEKLMSVLLPRLGMEIIGRDGQPNSYRMYHGNREIGWDETLGQAGVRDGDRLTISQEGQAGGAS